MTKVRIEKIDGNYRLEIDGDSHRHFSSTASDLITKPFTVSSRCNGIFDTNTQFSEFANTPRCNGIFDTNTQFLEFANDSQVFTVDVGRPWRISDYANPVAEISRRVKLVRDTFARIDAEKEVWEVEIGVEPIFAQGYKSSTPETRALVLSQLAATWEKFPELRFGQLLGCVNSDILFSIRDEILIEELQNFEVIN